MMKSEFIEKTGFEPTEAEYRKIEAEYMGCDIDKDEFCKTWKKQGGAQRLMRLRARRIEELEAELVKEKNDYDRMDAQMGLMRNKAAGEIEELLEKATEAERKLAVLKEAFAIITGKETK
jgi:molecular chaperone GrpE (heat shock protein)